MNGSWQLTEINCYLDLSNQVVATENYVITEASGVETSLIVNGSSINYSTTTDSCTTSATANLQTDFDGDLEDTLNFNEVLTSGTCNEDLSFSGASGGGTGTVKFTMLPIESKGLYWLVSSDKNELNLEFFSGFRGSSSGAYCAGNCTCLGKYQEI